MYVCKLVASQDLGRLEPYAFFFPSSTPHNTYTPHILHATAKYCYVSKRSFPLRGHPWGVGAAELADSAYRIYGRPHGLPSSTLRQVIRLKLPPARIMTLPLLALTYTRPTHVWLVGAWQIHRTSMLRSMYVCTYVSTHFGSICLLARTGLGHWVFSRYVTKT